MTNPFERARARMVRDQIRKRGVSDPRVLTALGDIPRERFVPPELAASPRAVYSDGALAIGRGQTLSQPFVVAAMTEALDVGPESRVLEVGTGSGYQSAVLSRLAGEVWTVERDPVLGAAARRRLEAMGCENVRYRIDDGSIGWEEGAPYDGILVTAAAPEVPEPLLDQLAPGGILLAPVGARTLQRLVRIRKDEAGVVGKPEVLMECRFVPLVGREGWGEGDDVATALPLEAP